MLGVGWVKPLVKVEGLARLNLRLRVRVWGWAELLAGWQGGRAGKGWQIGGNV